MNEIKPRKERRKIVIEHVMDDDGDLKYVIIPNYIKNDYFLSDSEIDYYKFLNEVVQLINAENNSNHLVIFSQVALNRILKQNNSREAELKEMTTGKSIDFVIYDLITEEIVLCIELDGDEHYYRQDRIKRDRVIKKAFDSANVFLYRQDVLKEYNKEEYLYIINEALNGCTNKLENYYQNKYEQYEKHKSGKEILQEIYENATDIERKTIDLIKEFRKNKAMSLNIKNNSRIFWDKDIAEIIKLNPSTIVDIEQSKLRANVKIYAEELMKIINNVKTDT